MRKSKKGTSQERLREIAWEVGAKYPMPLGGDHISLLMVTPRLGYVHWHIRKETVDALKATHPQGSNGAPMVVRIYDVTDILFDGSNAHMFFDIEVSGLSDSYYFPVDRPARSHLAEIGFRFSDGTFHYLARSNTTFFDRDRPSGDHQIAGLFVGAKSNRMFSVDNIFDAPVYEKMNQELSGIDRKGRLSVAVVFVGVNHTAGIRSPLGSFIRDSSERLKKFAVRVRLFSPRKKDVRSIHGKSLVGTIDALSKIVHKQIVAAHKKTPFHVIHCHDWYSSAAGLSAAKRLNVPMVLTLYSTEHERMQGAKLNRLSSTICRWEKRAVQAADLIVVPQSSVRRQVIELYGALGEKVVVIPYALSEDSSDTPSSPAEVRRWFGLSPDAPLVLFSGEISHAAGADLLVEALPTVCRNHSAAQFVFAGEGPLKDELQGRTWHAGIGHRCRFIGDVSKEIFEGLLAASDFVVVPAHTWQAPVLAQMAIGCGRPVLTTHQAGLECVVHGENGLVTFDNPGSIVWGIQELLSNPLHGSMLRLVAKRSAKDTPSVERTAAEYYTCYEKLIKNVQGAKDG